MNTAMPSWSMLSDWEVADLLAFISRMGDLSTKHEALAMRHYPSPGPTLGSKERGKELFGTLCAECHRTHGTGLKAPSLNDQVFLNAATNSFLLATITLGRPGTAMPVWVDSTAHHRALTAQQRKDLVAFIRSWQLVHFKQSFDSH